MHILGGLLFMWDMVPSSKGRFSSCLTKTRFWHSENEKCTFRGKKQNAFLTVPRAMHVCDMALLNFIYF
jgi:hypothetical protein